MAAVITGSAVAQAAPQFIAPQPGVTTPNNSGGTQNGGAQPGVTTPNSADAVRTPPVQSQVTPAEDRAGIAPESDYAPIREVPNRDYIAPLQPQELHAPEPTPEVAEIVPVPRTLRAGDLTTAAPDFLNAVQIDQINSAFARPEADISQFARSVGVAPSRADAVASGAIAGALQGAVAGCVGIAAFQAATVVTLPLLPLTCPMWAGLGAVVGGMVGAGMGGLR
ncbi:hypothetical protein JK358_14095 [Nocardia sp. 2]|uniref:Uncharacterized protein n=1 Tax=Nocardia acididurans TaxID=2802282 RepID=A0ABS1M4D7_9NOCA|nr:hypothetical protein [Nocardia acididurans]MBL1075527.1 hypothetical protein [Nocardia acididurans]